MLESDVRKDAHEWLVEEINHRVINEYAVVISSLCVAATRAANREAREQLTSAADRVHAFAQSHRALLPPKDQLQMNVGEYVSRICERMLEASLEARGVVIQLNTEDALLPARKCWCIGLVVAELVRNSCKHGFSGGSGMILISISHAAGGLCCTVGDNGRPSPDHTGGRGRGLIERIAAELGGSANWEFTPEGTVATLHIPAA